MPGQNKKSNQDRFPKVVAHLYPLYIPIIQALRTRPLLIRHLFKVKLCKGDNVSWDFTTLALKHALKQRFTHNTFNEKRILEIGVGQAALLSIYLAREYGITADGVDIIPERVARSNRTAQYNSVNLQIWQSDFFQHVEKVYDLIFWNASYIPTAFGEHHQLTTLEDVGDQRAWDGGSDGTLAIQRFLTQAPSYLTPNGEILLGVNNVYVSGDDMSHILESTPLVLSERISRRFNPSVVYGLRKK